MNFIQKYNLVKKIQKNKNKITMTSDAVVCLETRTSDDIQILSSVSDKGSKTTYSLSVYKSNRIVAHYKNGAYARFIYNLLKAKQNTYNEKQR